MAILRMARDMFTTCMDSKGAHSSTGRALPDLFSGFYFTTGYNARLAVMCMQRWFIVS